MFTARGLSIEIKVRRDLLLSTHDNTSSMSISLQCMQARNNYKRRHAPKACNILKGNSSKVILYVLRQPQQRCFGVPVTNTAPRIRNRINLKIVVKDLHKPFTIFHILNQGRQNYDCPFILFNSQGLDVGTISFRNDRIQTS